jgi:hypothetical protein
LREVFWIGGCSGAGKSTIVKRLADQYGLQYGLRLYSADEMMREHGCRTPPAERLFICAFAEMDLDGIYLRRPTGRSANHPSDDKNGFVVGAQKVAHLLERELFHPSHGNQLFSLRLAGIELPQ